MCDPFCNHPAFLAKAILTGVLKQYITLGSDNAWTGTVGSVKNMSSLIGIGFLKMTHQVYTVVDFLGPLGGYEARLAQRKPRAIKPYWASHLDIVNYRLNSEDLDIQLRI